MPITRETTTIKMVKEEVPQEPASCSRKRDLDVYALSEEVGKMAREVSREAMLHNRALSLMLEGSRMEVGQLKAEMAELKAELGELRMKQLFADSS
jgi:hypothetical protein